MRRGEMFVARYSRALFWTVVVGCMLYVGQANAAEYKARVSWQNPVENCNQTAIPQADYTNSTVRIYYKLGSGRPDPLPQGCSCVAFDYGNMVEVPATQTKARIEVDTPGFYHITLTFRNPNGEESCYSKEVRKEAKSETTEAPSFFEISTR